MKSESSLNKFDWYLFDDCSETTLGLTSCKSSIHSYILLSTRCKRELYLVKSVIYAFILSTSQLTKLILSNTFEILSLALSILLSIFVLEASFSSRTFFSSLFCYKIDYFRSISWFFTYLVKSFTLEFNSLKASLFI